MSGHTKGRITVRHISDCGHYDLEVGDEAIGQVFYTDNMPGGRGEADADRLADCWNACEGINPEAVPDMLAALKAAVMALDLVPHDLCKAKVNAKIDAAMKQASSAVAKAEAQS